MIHPSAPPPPLPPKLTNSRETAASENASSYYPLLNRIAEGYFDTPKTDHDLYKTFRLLLQQDGHLTKPEDLSSFDFALSIHSTAPRIEAHYQFYNTSVKPLIDEEQDEGCESWAHVPGHGQRFCSADMDASDGQQIGGLDNAPTKLPFDRLLGSSTSSMDSILYADITSPSFSKLHQRLSQTAQGGRGSYRLRYKPSNTYRPQPLTVSGYGIELALKRTDYIVIDDRQAEETVEEAKTGEATLSEEEVSDLRPLTSSEALRLALKAASFVMSSDDKFGTLLRLTQDFPKHSGAIASANVTDEFMIEHRGNRDMVPAGYNVIWINGVQIMARDLDAYNILEHLRRERKMINSVRGIGLSGPQAIDLLSNEAVAASQIQDEVQRYDWRDETEGGEVIIWLNDIEKDTRYSDWPGSVQALLARTYPGQLPSVRRNAHAMVTPIDFSNYADVSMVVESLQTFVKRKIPIRFGLVPRFNSPAGDEQARVVYYLLDTYGIGPMLAYLDESIISAGRKLGRPQEKSLTKATEGRKLRGDRVAKPFENVLKDIEVEGRVKGAQNYIERLGSGDAKPPTFINGVPVPYSDDWLQAMSQRVGIDSRTLQEAVFTELVDEDSHLPDIFLEKALPRRNSMIIPEDEKAIQHLDLSELPMLADLPSRSASDDTIESELVHLTVAANFRTLEGFETVMEALLFAREHDNVEVALLHAPIFCPSRGNSLLSIDKTNDQPAFKSLLAYYDRKAGTVGVPGNDLEARKPVYHEMWSERFDGLETADVSDHHWGAFKPIALAAGLPAELLDTQKALIINGRLVGPMPGSARIEIEDLESLLSYERRQRLLPASKAIRALKLEEKASTPFAFARISNLIAQSIVSDVPEGIFESASTVRTSISKTWNSTHTAIKTGDIETANVQIVASIDPASETAQRWVPILNVLSELEGVHTSLFLNPKERLEELPIKRFYRHVLSSKPSFDADGALQAHKAHFSGLPADALLNMGMDMPPSWLVAPSDSIHDLDNIKLSAVKSGTDIEATYELEHILIEGHSRDLTIGNPPRGAQLVLGTEHDPHVADTIVMANIGYFQFKANPGIYNLALQKGRSQEIFNIDSASTSYVAATGDNSTQIALMSFRGTTLYPRLSRKPGMEEEDVLEATKSAAEGFADKADGVLASAGLPKLNAGKYVSKAANFFSTGRTDAVGEKHADINIFSVASGHLYERMLNIMMVSVVKHTKHTVKFWFIEQFLSPSFKDFLPVMAEEYGFKYEMVTYKWPHWLRQQKEKQREIWGYKILFLDVLFPLDLDKVIFVDADQIVRTDMYELVQHDLQGAPYGFTPMGDSRTEMEGFRFWKQGYWANFLRGRPYHISALYVVDLKKFRQIAAGDRLRQQYHQLSADPASLSNLDQDLPNHMQAMLPIHSLPQEWLWCETWCSDEDLKTAKTIDLCNNPQTKEPKLDRARRQVPEWTVYDDEIAAVAKRHAAGRGEGRPVAGKAGDAGVQGKEEESVQERLQREDAEREARKRSRDEL